MAKKSAVSKATKTQEVETPVEETPVETPQEEDVQVEEPQEVQENDGNIVTQLLDKFDEIFKTNKMAADYHKKVNSDLMELRKQVKAIEKKFKKMEQKNSTKRKVTHKSKKYVVVNQKFQQLIEKNHSVLLNKNDVVIIENLEYNEAGKLVITRPECLQILSSYVKKHNLQDQEDRKKIKLDATLFAILPDFGKKSGKEIVSNLEYKTLMSAISKLIE